MNAFRKTCEVCNGLGYMSDLFESAIHKQIKEIIDATIPQTFMKFSQNLQRSQQDLNMEDQNDEPLFDEHAEARRIEKMAQELLNSTPFNVPRKERQIQDVQLLSETPKHNFTLIAGERATKTYTFKNTSQQDIQEGAVLS